MRDRRLLAFAATVTLVTAAVVAILVGMRGRGAAAHAAGVAATVHIGRSRLGRVLVGPDGRTLYAFSVDRDGVSRCEQACARLWSPLLVPRGGATAGPGVGRLAQSRRRDGREQVVYHGHPLYAVVSDTRPGQLTGQAYEDSWFAVTPAGRLVTTGAKAAPDY